MIGRKEYEHFPSPIGDLFYLMDRKQFEKNKIKYALSVPYRGLILFNLARRMTAKYRLLSVPYRGLILFNLTNEIITELEM